MKREEAIKVLKRMKTPDMEADEFAGIQVAIKALETLGKLEAVIKALKPTREPADAYDEAFTDGYVTAADTIMDILKGVEK